MNTDINNEEYPRLTPPEVVYEHKASLKKPVMIPLYAKIVAAAATVALLIGIFWHRSVMPEQELMAELSPIVPTQVVSTDVMTLAESQAHFIMPKQAPKPVVCERAESPLLAELQPITAPTLVNVESQPELWLDEGVYYASAEMPYTGTVSPSQENYDDLSMIGRGIYKMTNGECDSFASIFSEGLKSVKTELASLETTLQSSRSQLRQMVH